MANTWAYCSTIPVWILLKALDRACPAAENPLAAPSTTCTSTQLPAPDRYTPSVEPALLALKRPLRSKLSLSHRDAAMGASTKTL